MEVTVDSHALLWYLSKNNKLSPKAKEVLDNSKKILVSVIVLLELLYIFQKFHHQGKFTDMIRFLSDTKYLIYPIDLALVKECAKLPNELEMHDRLIVATAKIFKMPIITKDRQIAKVYQKVIW